MVCLRAFLRGAGVSLVLTSGAVAQQDPFDILLGDGRIDASAEARPGDDDLVVLELNLRRMTLTRDMPAFFSDAGLCIPLEPLFEALEFPIQFDQTGASGWFADSEQTVSLRFEPFEVRRNGVTLASDQDQFSQSTDGPCLTTQALSDWFAMPFVYDERSLVVRIEPAIVLPLEARLERQLRREEFERSEAAASDDDLIAYNPPYRWLSWPSVDLDLSVQTSSQGGVQTELGWIAAGEIARMTAHARGGYTQDGASGPVRFRLERKDPDGKALAFIPVTAIEIGDVAAPNYDLQMRAQTGRGVRLTNRALFRPEVFDQTTLRGPLPPGWEAELQVNGELSGFVTEPDALGDYVFEAVDLLPGYNRIVVELYGPYGETATRETRIFVGADLLPENEMTYELGVVLPHASERDPLAEAAPSPAAYASLAYGLNPALTVGARAVMDIDSGQTSVALSSYRTIGASYLGLDALADSQGGYGAQLNLQTRLNARSSLSLRHAQLAGLVNSAVGLGDNRLAYLGRLRFNTAVQGFGERVPVQLFASWAGQRDGRTRFSAGARASGVSRGVFWTQALSATRLQSGDDAGRFEAGGEMLASRVLPNGRLRAGFSYAIAPDLAPRRADIAWRYRNRLGRTGQLGLGYSFNDARTDMRASVSSGLGPAQISASARIDDAGQWACGMRLSVSLYRDDRRGRFALAPSGLSQSGALRTISFDDLDANGVFDAGEPALSEVEYIIGNTLRSEASDSSGATLFTGLEPHGDQAVEMKRATLYDPFLRPTITRQAVRLRPGRIVDLPMPVVATGEVEGQAVYDAGDGEMPVSGVRIEALDMSGQVIGSTQTEFDGYFYFADLIAGPVTIRVAPQSLEDAGAIAEPVSLSLSRENPSSYGLKIAIIDNDS